MRYFVTAYVAALAGGFFARAEDHTEARRSFSKAAPVEVAFVDEKGCFVHPLVDDHGAAGTSPNPHFSVAVDPFICEQLGAEEHRRAELRALRYPRPAPVETSGGGY